MSILRQTYCSPKYLYYLLPGQAKKVRQADGSLRRDILVRDVVDFERRWHVAVEALKHAIDMLRHPQEFGATSSQYLPYISILPVFASLQRTVKSLEPSQQLDAQRKLRHWYWASVFTNRYSGSVESTAARDYQDVKAWFADDRAEPALIGEFRSRFRNLELRRETKRGTSVYNGIFNLLVLRGARDWMTGTIPPHGDLDDHHIVPKKWGKDNGLSVEIDAILNRTPMTAATNREVIGDRLPSHYLPGLIAANGEAAVRATLESHYISPAAFDILLRDPFTREDFEEFITERQRTLQAAIEDLLIKERLDLSPQLRELDARIETIELTVRSLIEQKLAGGALPSHIEQKIQERLQSAARKNPALEVEEYQGLARKLEYADLRELEGVISNKGLWPHFETTFGSKESLSIRFGQLAELRNGIRHSRSVDEVTQKGGEAGILWFEKVLGISASERV